MRNYGLDPAHHVSSPQLRWDAMLRHTNCMMDLILNPEMFSMVDVVTPGGMSMI